jgi:hypothetical protein
MPASTQSPIIGGPWMPVDEPWRFRPIPDRPGGPVDTHLDAQVIAVPYLDKSPDFF